MTTCMELRNAQARSMDRRNPMFMALVQRLYAYTHNNRDLNGFSEDFDLHFDATEQMTADCARACGVQPQPEDVDNVASASTPTDAARKRWKWERILLLLPFLVTTYATHKDAHEGSVVPLAALQMPVADLQATASQMPIADIQATASQVPIADIQAMTSSITGKSREDASPNVVDEDIKNDTVSALEKKSRAISELHTNTSNVTDWLNQREDVLLDVAALANGLNGPNNRFASPEDGLRRARADVAVANISYVISPSRDASRTLDNALIRQTAAQRSTHADYREHLSGMWSEEDPLLLANATIESYAQLTLPSIDALIGNVKLMLYEVSTDRDEWRHVRLVATIRHLDSQQPPQYTYGRAQILRALSDTMHETSQGLGDEGAHIQALRRELDAAKKQLRFYRTDREQAIQAIHVMGSNSSRTESRLAMTLDAFRKMTDIHTDEQRRVADALSDARSAATSNAVKLADAAELIEQINVTHRTEREVLAQQIEMLQRELHRTSVTASIAERDGLTLALELEQLKNVHEETRKSDEQAAQDTIRQLRARIANLERDAAGEEERLTTQLRDAEMRLEATRQKAQELTATIDELEAQNKALSSDVDRRNTEQVALRHKMRIILNSVRLSTDRSIRDLRQQLQRVSGALDAANNDRQGTMQELHSLRTQFDRANSMRLIVEETGRLMLANMTRELEQEQNRSTSLSTAYDYAQSQMRALEERLETKVQLHEADVRRHATERTELQIKVADLSEYVRDTEVDAQSKSSQYENEISVLIMEKIDLQHNLIEQRNETSRLETEVSRVRELARDDYVRYETLQYEANETRSHLEDVTVRLAQKEAHFTALTAAVAARNRDIEVLRKNVSSLRDTNSREAEIAQTRLDTAQRNLADLLSGNKTAYQRIEDLQQELVGANAEIRQRNQLHYKNYRFRQQNQHAAWWWPPLLFSGTDNAVSPPWRQPSSAYPTPTTWRAATK